MFDTLSEKLQSAFAGLRGRGVLTEEDVTRSMREIRLALLEADVNFKVVKEFIEAVRARALGAEVQGKLNPGQQVIKIVGEELTAMMGGESPGIAFASRPPTVIMMVGLQGSGKTTAAAKLARWFRQQGRHPYLIGADLQRPAAVEQLRVLGAEVGVGVFSEPTEPVAVARRGLGEAERLGRDVVIIDTAGRLAIDRELMDELRRVSAAVHPQYTFFVVDAMTGQDAVQTAEAFHQALQLDGIILTKVDGDARGGAALSVKHVVGRPIAFLSTGERVADFEIFHPDRLASRILGMGDVLSLIEKAEREYDQEVAGEAFERLQSGKFTLDDFLDQLRQIKKMGPLSGLLGMMPGLPKEMRDAKVDERDMGKVEAIICSMTARERADPTVLDGSRRLRIAHGSGTSTSEVNNLLRQFKEMQKMMRGVGPMAKLAGVGRPNKSPKGSRKKVKGGRVTPSPKGLGPAR